MITQLNSKQTTYLVSTGVTNIFCNLKCVPKAVKQLNNSDETRIYQFIENGKTFAPVTLHEIKNRIKNAK